MATETTLTPAKELAKKNDKRYPNESGGYREARDTLLAAEIELRRHIWRVGEMRRALPPGGDVTKDYRFVGEHGEVGLEELFGDHDTLVVYSMMYGPQRTEGCPMCTAQLSAWDGAVPNLEQRIALIVTARSHYERIAAYGRERGWKNLKLYSDPSGDFTEDYVGDRHADMPAYTVFTRKDGVIRHFYSAEANMEMADPGQDPHDAPDMNPLWVILDTTPEGRGTDWYPQLEYDSDIPRGG
ncbi:MAG: Uncharacterized protein conserved in bacteria [uncultured Thermomicrobiales bacterium]|uniref:Uncharacterized protein conserved in bacteria n=1 Tax=uncultured Thermomicrobiales bacterium TaxID=1645740 RepID=A0A6J4UAW9_9BACT|nr:MAG: Uncharacterized protein conserved in bacteria [uncultured Thermomicrobiales bacterium]